MPSSIRSTNSTAKGANALLKILEEPPRRALLLLVSHSAARVLPTIRSRCRLLALRPLPAADVARAAATALGQDPDAADIRAAAAVADGSVRRALALLDGEALELRNRITALLERLPAVDPRALHALGDASPAPIPRRSTAFVDTVNAWLSARLDTSGPDSARLARVAEAWEKVNRSARDVETTIWNESRWFSTSSAGLPRRRAVDT